MDAISGKTYFISQQPTTSGQTSSFILPRSPTVLKLFERCNKIASQKGSVLITGESGTGKTLLANWIHDKSGRNKVIRKGCGEFDQATLEATFFGHSKGAYTGAISDQIGIFQQAHKGTIILDDIDYLPLKYQSRLLRILDDGTFYRLGEPGNPIVVDIRLLTTSNKNLDSYVRQNHFLPDLLYRLKRWEVWIPPLRERPEDIRQLSKEFLTQFQQTDSKNEKKYWHFDESALDLLCSLKWPGNIRQLKVAIENVALFAKGKRCPIQMSEVADILFDQTIQSGEYNYKRNELQNGSNFIHQMLESTNWNISVVSRVTGLSRTTIYKRIKQNEWETPQRLSNK